MAGLPYIAQASALLSGDNLQICPFTCVVRVSLPLIYVCLHAGVLLNVLVPDWLQTVLLTLLLLFVINKTVRKGITQWRQEQKVIQQKRSQDAHVVRRAGAPKHYLLHC